MTRKLLFIVPAILALGLLAFGFQYGIRGTTAAPPAGSSTLRPGGAGAANITSGTAFQPGATCDKLAYSNALTNFIGPLPPVSPGSVLLTVNMIPPCPYNVITVHADIQFVDNTGGTCFVIRATNLVTTAVTYANPDPTAACAFVDGPGAGSVAYQVRSVSGVFTTLTGYQNYKFDILGSDADANAFYSAGNMVVETWRQ